jgi:hypothetical protein
VQRRQVTVLFADVVEAHRGRVLRFTGDGVKAALGMAVAMEDDDGSLDLLQHLVAHAAELPLALVMSARPALLQRIHGVLPRLAELVVGQAEGNPYYMEELVRRLIDDDVIVVAEPHWTGHADRLDTVRLQGALIGLPKAERCRRWWPGNLAALTRRRPP